MEILDKQTWLFGKKLTHKFKDLSDEEEIEKEYQKYIKKQILRNKLNLLK